MNKNPKLILKVGDMRALVQRTTPDLMDDEAKEEINRLYGSDLPDLYQFFTTLPYTVEVPDRYGNMREEFHIRPSMWFTAGGDYCSESIRITMDIHNKFRKGLPLIIELKYGTYEAIPYWSKTKK